VPEWALNDLHSLYTEPGRRSFDRRGKEVVEVDMRQ